MLRESVRVGLDNYALEYLIFGLVVATAITWQALQHPDAVEFEVDLNPILALALVWAAAFILWPFVVAFLLWDAYNDNGPWKG